MRKVYVPVNLEREQREYLRRLAERHGWKRAGKPNLSMAIRDVIHREMQMQTQAVRDGR